ncbi:hypothetical protein CALCODRAFT_517835 [Calocera cornea HHB12733]|uniref:P/Homo B domain-containing protein n=1 Tax=Calocera cornea HHB12733 TaxID=1353952 RepID=A0A165FJD8_9BASI|nr:hypothetical protein CALCODRAFT_517835 [Calocera cornea HHB12733]
MYYTLPTAIAFCLLSTVIAQNASLEALMWITPSTASEESQTGVKLGFHVGSTIRLDWTTGSGAPYILDLTQNYPGTARRWLLETTFLAWKVEDLPLGTWTLFLKDSANQTAPRLMVSILQENIPSTAPADNTTTSTDAPPSDVTSISPALEPTSLPTPTRLADPQTTAPPSPSGLFAPCPNRTAAHTWANMGNNSGGSGGGGGGQTDMGTIVSGIISALGVMAAAMITVWRCRRRGGNGKGEETSICSA